MFRLPIWMLLSISKFSAGVEGIDVSGVLICCDMAACVLSDGVLTEDTVGLPWNACWLACGVVGVEVLNPEP